MGAFSTVLLAIVLIFAAVFYKTSHRAYAQKSCCGKRASPVHARDSRALSCLSLLVLAAQGIRNVRSVLQC